MKDIIKRSVISIIFGGLLAYLVLLITQNQPIVQTQFANMNFVYFAGLIIVCLYMLLFFGIYPMHIRFTKATLFVFGIALVVVGQYVLVNDATKNLYIGDISKVFGVFFIITAWGNLLITDKIRKRKEQKGVEIIEV